MLRSFLKNESGNLQAVFAVIMLLVGLGIGSIVFSQVMDQASTTAQDLNDTQAQNFVTDLKNIGFNSLNLLSILAFVVVAVVIIAVLSRGFGGGGGGI